MVISVLCIKGGDDLDVQYCRRWKIILNVYLKGDVEA